MMNHPTDNADRLVHALVRWLEQNMTGDPDYVAVAAELVKVILSGRPVEGTPFEWLAALLGELEACSRALSGAAELDAFVAAEGARVAASLEEILSGGIGLGLARGFLEECANAAPAQSFGQPSEALPGDAAFDDLDDLFGAGDVEVDLQSFIADMLPETHPGEALQLAAAHDAAELNAAPAPESDLDSPATAAPEHEAAPATESTPEPEPELAPEAPEAEIDHEAHVAAAQAVIENVMELVRIAPLPADEAPEQAAAAAAEPPAVTVSEPEPEPGPASVSPAEPSPEPEQPAPDSRQVATELAGKIRTLVVGLEHNPENQQNALAQLISHIREIDRRVRHLGHRLFSSLADAVLAILETLLGAREPIPFDVIEKLGEFSQAIDAIVHGNVSRNKSYYALIKELNEVHDLLSARIEESRELRRLEAQARQEAEGLSPAAHAGASGDDRPGGAEGGAGHGHLTNIQEVFLVEAAENIDALTRNLLLIEKNPADPEVIFTLMRAAHSIKGSAAIARFTQISAVAHAMEDLLVIFRDEALAMTGEAINLLLAGVDQLQALCLAAEHGEESPQEPLDRLIEILKAAAARTLENKESLRAGAATAPPAAPAPAIVRSAPAPQAEKAEVRFVRVEIGQLDSLMNLAADLVINRTRLLAQTERQQAMLHAFSEYRRRLKLLGSRLTALLSANRVGEEPPMLAGAVAERALGRLPRHARLLVGSSFSRSGQQLLRDFSAGEFDRFNELDLLARDIRETAAFLEDLGENMGQIATGMEQNISQVSHVANDLHQSIMKTRMVPIGQIFSRFPRVVRDLSAELGKQIELHLAGEDTLLDKNIIEEIASPLVHIIRNAVDHGLETVEERERLAKDPTGNVWLSARLTGNQVLIEIRDDGRGIDPTKLRQTAVSRNFLSEEEAAACSEAELFGLLLLPGFSTAEQVTDLSGRGVGLDVVNQAMKNLRGSLHIASEFNEGTTISIRLPITLAINQALLFRSAGETFAIPLSSVDELIAAPETRVIQTGDQTVIMLRGQIIPLFKFDELVGLTPDDTPDSQRQIMIVNDGVNRGGLIVDALIGREEIVVKTLGNHLRSVPYFSGCTILGDGQVTLIVNPSHILHSGAATTQPLAASGRLELHSGDAAGEGADSTAQRAARRRTAGASGEARGSARENGSRRRRILVTDDSISIRRFVSGILESAGFEVEMACDGVDALEKLEDAEFDLLLTDLEMPRMHGYELISEVRASAGRHRDIPIIILTSRMGDKHSRKGLELGASAFMVKPFEQMQLLATVNSLVAPQHA